MSEQGAASDRPPGKLLTFYSYKGGTGRSMALANVAWILASNGKRVLAVDWDLEAPGLHRYFAPFLIDPDLSATDGLIDMMVEFELKTVGGRGGQVGADWFRQQGAAILEYTTALEYEEFREGGELHFLPAGRQGPGYAARVNSFDWRGLYQNRGGELFFEGAREALKKRFDYILLDSRTGVSDTSGICTVQMPDVLVACFTLNNQGIEGASAVVSDVHRQRHPRAVATEKRVKDAGEGRRTLARPLAIFPVPMRVESAEKERTEHRLRHAQARFAGFPNDLTPRATVEEYWAEAVMPHIPYYAFEEILATFGDRPGDPGSFLSASERLAWFLTDGAVRRVVPPGEGERERVLRQYARNAVLQSSGPLAPEQLAEQAELTYSRLVPPEQDAVRRLFMRLVRVARPEEGGDSWLRLPTSALDEVELDTVRKLIQAGVVRLSSDPMGGVETVEVANPALRRSWKRLAGWLDGDREFLLWRRRLGVSVAEWESSEGDASTLLTGARLRNAERWLAERGGDLPNAERRFIQASVDSRTHQQKQQERANLRAQRIRWGTAGVGAVLAVLMAISVYLQLDRGQALDSERQALQTAQSALAQMRASNYFARGQGRLDSNDLNGALRDFTEAIAADSTYAPAYYERANILLFRGDAALAVRDYTAALRMQPDYAQAYDSRATAYLQLGDTTRARGDLAKFVDITSNTERRDSARTWLARLTAPAQVADTASAAAPVLTNPPPQPEVSTVYINYRDPADTELARELRRALEAEDRRIMAPERRTRTISRLTVRYFYLGDQERAEALRRDLQRELTLRDVVEPVELLPLTQGYERASRGLLEVWLPSTRPAAAPADTTTRSATVPDSTRNRP